MYGMKEQKHPKVPTSEMLDFVGQKINYEDDKERDKQNDYKEDLELRFPFEHIKRKIDQQQQQINSLQTQVNNLLKHEHGKDGKPVIPICDRRLC